MESMTLCMMERLIKLMKTQEEVYSCQGRLKQGLSVNSKKQKEDSTDLSRRLWIYDMLSQPYHRRTEYYLLSTQDYHKTHTTIETLKLNVSREILKQLRNNKQPLQIHQNIEQDQTTSKVQSCKNCGGSQKGKQSQETNKMTDNSSTDTLKESTLLERKGQHPLIKRLSIDTTLSIPTPSNPLYQIENTNSSAHLLVSFDKYRIPSLYDYDKLVPKIALWTGQLFSDLSSSTFERLKSNQLTKDQMKVYFSSNLILNSVLFMGYITENYPYIWKPRRNDILDLYNTHSKNALTYLMTKYTVKKRESVDHSCDQIIKQFSLMEHPDNDSLASTKIRFDFNKDKQYASKIKQVLNAYIKLTKRYYNRFEREINKVATIDLTRIQEYPCIAINDLGSSKIINAQDPSFLGPYHNNDMSLLPDAAPINSNRQMSKSTRYAQKQIQPPLPSNTKVLKGMVGMKIKPETGLYTVDELQQKGIKIKTAEVLRVIIKWISDLEKKVNDISAFTVERDTPFANKNIGGSPVELSLPLKQLLREKIKESVERFQTRNQEIGQVKAALTQLYTCIEKNRDTFQFIPQNQVVVGLATYILSDPVSKITTGYLESLIHCLLEAEHNFNACSGREPISLISFGIYDLLRAKFSGTKEDIIAAYNILCESKSFKVIRIKNRLDTINKDFLINLRLVGTPLICELQLGITLQIAKKNQKSQSFQNFSHFLYELDRAKDGPLIEAVIINYHECPTISYFETALKEMKVRTLDFSAMYNKQTNSLSVLSYAPIKSDAPFSCNNCWKFIYPSSSFLQSFEEKVGKGKSYQKICGQCIIQRLTAQEKKSYLLGDIAEVFQEINIKQIPKLRDGLMRYICAVFNGSNKNYKILEVRGSTGKTIQLVQPFVQQNLICEIYELQDLSISYAFKLKDDLALTCTPLKDLSKDDIISNPELSISKLNRTQYLTVKLKQRRLVLDVWSDSPTQKLCKSTRLNNIRGVLELLREQSQSQQNLRARISEFISSRSINIPNRKLIGIDMFVTKHLQILNVSSNNISLIQLQNYDVPELLELDLSNNQLTILDLRNCKLSSLRMLIAYCNSLEKFDLDEGLSSLNSLDIGSNRLEVTSLFTGIALSNLTIIILQNNFIRQIDFQNSKLPELKTLNLQHNHLSVVDGCQHLNKLQFLDLMSFGSGFKSIKRLDISANRLYKVSGLSSETIRDLDLSFNYLQNFDLHEFQNTKIESINLAYNKLTEINYETGMIKSLRELLLQKNKITEIKWDRSLHSNLFIRMADRRNLQEYTNLEIVNMFNWQLNQLPNQQISSVTRYLGQIETQRENSVVRTSSDVPPLIRYDAPDISVIKELLIAHSMMPEENPVSSYNSMRQVENRLSSLNPSAATRLRRIIEENL